jgi:allantoicase
MSDGWETRRSQLNRGKYGPGGALEGKERSEWVIAKLAGTGVVRYVEVDTAYHPGNYPVVSYKSREKGVELIDRPAKSKLSRARR